MWDSALEPQMNYEAWQRRLGEGRRGVQMSHGDYTVCMRQAENLVQLEDVAGAIQQSLQALMDCQEQCRMRINAMKGAR